jgi:hypothetical protein
VSAGGGIYERLICVVPIVGTGTVDDPKRPMFVPLPGHAAADARPSKGFSDPPAIVGFHSVLSDDGQSAIVEFIARDRAAFKPILAQPANLLFSADPHLQPSATLLQQLRKFNKNFNLASFLRGGL